MRSTMEDIAREAGVSSMTVSRVMSGRSCVSTATREKVLKAVQRRNYEVNALAQNFAQKRAGFVGVATPLRLVGTEYFGQIMQGIERVFGGTAWEYALFNMQPSSLEDGQRLLKLHRARRVDGLFVIAPSGNDRFLDVLADNDVPLVVIGKAVKNPRICWIGCDDYGGVTSLCEHLFAYGHRRIAFVGGPKEFTVAKQRGRAYADFCRQHRLSLPDWFTQRGDYTLRSGREAGAALRFDQPSRPTAIIAANDAMALGVMESARENSLNLPGDLSVAGFDDISMAAQSFPALTTVRQPVAEMAVHAAERLYKALSEGNRLAGHDLLPVQLVTRASTGKVRRRPGQ